MSNYNFTNPPLAGPPPPRGVANLLLKTDAWGGAKQDAVLFLVWVVLQTAVVGGEGGGQGVSLFVRPGSRCVRPLTHCD